MQETIKRISAKIALLFPLTAEEKSIWALYGGCNDDKAQE